MIRCSEFDGDQGHQAPGAPRSASEDRPRVPLRAPQEGPERRYEPTRSFFRKKVSAVLKLM